MCPIVTCTGDRVSDVDVFPLPTSHWGKRVLYGVDRECGRYPREPVQGMSRRPRARRTCLLRDVRIHIEQERSNTGRRKVGFQERARFAAKVRGVGCDLFPNRCHCTYLASIRELSRRGCLEESFAP